MERKGFLEGFEGPLWAKAPGCCAVPSILLGGAASEPIQPLNHPPFFTYLFLLPCSDEFWGVIQHAGHGQSGVQSLRANWEAVRTNSVNTEKDCNPDTNFALKEIIPFEVLEYLFGHEQWQGCCWSTYHCLEHGPVSVLLPGPALTWSILTHALDRG